MPGFPPGATVVQSVQDIALKFRSSTRSYRRSISSDAVAPNIILGEITTWAQAAGKLSTLGLEYYEGLGIRNQISIASVSIFDEMYSGKHNMVFNFQRAEDLDLQQFRLPGINAAYVKDGLVLKDTSDPDVGADISAFLAAHLVLLNKDLTGGALYAFVGAFLDDAPAGSRALRAQDSQIVEPTTGDPTGLPDDDSAT